jgi:hypothetical protein
VKRLFNEYEAMNEDGNMVADHTERLIKGLVSACQTVEFSLRDVHNIIDSTVSCVIAEAVLRADLERRKQERKNRVQPNPTH